MIILARSEQNTAAMCLPCNNLNVFIIEVQTRMKWFGRHKNKKSKDTITHPVYVMAILRMATTGDSPFISLRQTNIPFVECNRPLHQCLLLRDLPQLPWKTSNHGHLYQIYLKNIISR